MHLSRGGVLAEPVPVVKRDHQKRVLQYSEIAGPVQESPQPVVNHRYLSRVTGAHVLKFGICQVVARPVVRMHDRRAIVVGGGVEGEVLVRGGPDSPPRSRGCPGWQRVA